MLWCNNSLDYITNEINNDGWLLDSLNGFLIYFFIKSSLGNNEAQYRHCKANGEVLLDVLLWWTSSRWWWVARNDQCKSLWTWQCAWSSNISYGYKHLLVNRNAMSFKSCFSSYLTPQEGYAICFEVTHSTLSHIAWTYIWSHVFIFGLMKLIFTLPV